MIIYRQDNPPDEASSADRWVDTYDFNKIWLIHTAYDFSLTKSTLTLLAADRPGSVDLVFEAQALGNVGNNTYVQIADQGASGTSALVKTGTGTKADPFIYLFNTYQDDNSNDSIIALLVGDIDLAATGADATSADVPDIIEQLDNGVMSNLTASQLVIKYKSIPPTLVNGTSTIDESIPANVRTLLADGLAARMSGMNEGGGISRSADKWEKKLRDAILKARENAASTTYPGGFRL
jgi:hypothetical protein